MSQTRKFRSIITGKDQQAHTSANQQRRRSNHRTRARAPQPNMAALYCLMFPPLFIPVPAAIRCLCWRALFSFLCHRIFLPSCALLLPGWLVENIKKYIEPGCYCGAAACPSAGDAWNARWNARWTWRMALGVMRHRGVVGRQTSSARASRVHA